MTSSSTVISTAASCGNATPYVLSMQRICQYVGLPIPTWHPLFPSPSSPSDCGDDGVTESDEGVDRLSEAYAASNPFLHAETSPAYRALLQQAPPTERHVISVKRHLGLALWNALRKGKCLYCWLPRQMCMCAELWEARTAYVKHQQHDTGGAVKQLRGSLQPTEIVPPVQVTMFLHAEEFLRTTNTAHLCAFIMDSPMRVWGVPSDDAWLSEIGGGSEERSSHTNSVATRCTVHSDVDVHHHQRVTYALLYPEEGCAQVSDLMASLPLENHTLHYVLSDGTWTQAHRVNRHVPRTVPRVALTIDPSYTSLFSSLRKQTRETGVSTLEATAMAVRQRLIQVHNEHLAETLHDSLVAHMKQYVDKVCIQKRQAAVYAVDSEKIATWKAERNAHNTWEYRTYHEEKEKQRVSQVLDHIGNDLRTLLPPPVVAYCYVCDRFIGWSRMDTHVMGQLHKDNLPHNPEWEPSELSRRPEKGNWHVTSKGGGVIPLLQ